MNDPVDFADQAVDGLVDVYARYLTRTYGGVIRSGSTRPGKVAVVVGGGSGHYPAFAGWVGPGLADAAVVGNIFSSPSTQQILSVARAVHDGAGVLLSYGNYAGDVLNFSLAEERLRAEGIPAVSIAVTDDVSSASLDERSRRRGVAGDLVVFKIAGAAAEAGLDLAEVAELAERANAATFSFGVAFAGCTLPGERRPLFTVPAGQMGVGLGVHGEPGVAEEPVEPAADLAARLVDRLLAERPASAQNRVAVLLNGLGATKYEELFLLWNDVRRLLQRAGLEIVQPEVGELITSLDMAGVSLTLTWLDAQLEDHWTAPADTPALRRGGGIATRPRTPRAETGPEQARRDSAGPTSRALAGRLVGCLESVAARLHESESDLGALDAIAGDGDHGRGMTTGCDAALAAARQAVESGAGLTGALAAAGDAWADKAGGTSGALWGNGLHAAALALDESSLEATGPGSVPVARQAVASVAAARDLVQTFGKAQRRDKTLLDALIPFVEELERRVDDGDSLAGAWSAAAAAAVEEAEATAALSPRIGRSRVLAERSKGHPDPGATSLALVLSEAGRHLA
nr:dihydroxyacetone kinase family protein [Microlunatus panaciterrae]